MRVRAIFTLTLQLLVRRSCRLGRPKRKTCGGGEKRRRQGRCLGSIENDTMELMSVAFKKKSGLGVEFWCSSSTKVMDRVLGGSRTDKTYLRCGFDDYAEADKIELVELVEMDQKAYAEKMAEYEKSFYTNDEFR